MTKAGQAAVKVNKAKGTQIPVVYCIQSILSVHLSICRESIGAKMISWIDKLEYLFRDTCMCATTTTRRGNWPKRQCCWSAIETSKHHRVNTFFTSLDKVLAEIENRFSGNDHDVLCALGDITKSDSPTSDSFDVVASYYNFDKELLQADQHLFNRFKKMHAEKSIKTGAEVIDALHEKTLYEIASEFIDGGVRFGRHSHNITLSAKIIQRTLRRLKS